MTGVKALHLEDIIEAVREHRPDADVEVILRAYTFASRAHGGQTRLSGESYMSHPMQVAKILAGMKMEPPVIAAGLLHDTLEDTESTLEELTELFGSEISTMVDGLTKIGRIVFSSREDKQAENIRKMILALSDDLRIVIIKLADRLHNMLTLEYLPPDRQRSISRETMDIYAPLADRLGLHWIKVELENISFKYLLPNEYSHINGIMKEHRDEIEDFLSRMVTQMQEILRKEQISAHVVGRPKHYYSIYKKMMDQGLEFEQVYDIMGIRVITNNTIDCYRVLGLIHNAWKPIPGKFKDYIALPKKNGYQSIHTAVFGSNGKFVEFQVRTQQMHRQNEEGIAAHWRYKEGTSGQGKEDERFVWLRRLFELGRSVGNSREFMENLKADLFPDEVYVFTPKQEVKAFPSGATPVDFAYAVHTQIGHKCIGAMINGRYEPLDYALKNGDIVKILTSEEHEPERDWLKYAVTSHAKSKIRTYLHAREKADAIELGRNILEEEIKKHGLKPENYLTEGAMEQAAAALGLKNSEAFLQKVGFAKISVYRVLQKLLPPEAQKKVESASKMSFKDILYSKFWPRANSDIGVRVGNPENMLMRFAGCCNPVPGDAIFGFITRGHGLVIHNRSCPKLKEQDPDPERLIEAQWEKPKKKKMHPVRILVYGLNKPGLLAHVTHVIAECKVNISNAVVNPTDKVGGELTLTVEIEDLNHLQKVIQAVKGVDGVKKVERVMEAPHHKPIKK